MASVTVVVVVMAMAAVEERRREEEESPLSRLITSVKQLYSDPAVAAVAIQDSLRGGGGGGGGRRGCGLSPNAVPFGTVRFM